MPVISIKIVSSYDDAGSDSADRALAEIRAGTEALTERVKETREAFASLEEGAKAAGEEGAAAAQKAERSQAEAAESLRRRGAIAMANVQAQVIGQMAEAVKKALKEATGFDLNDVINDGITGIITLGGAQEKAAEAQRKRLALGAEEQERLLALAKATEAAAEETDAYARSVRMAAEEEQQRAAQQDAEIAFLTRKAELQKQIQLGELGGKKDISDTGRETERQRIESGFDAAQKQLADRTAAARMESLERQIATIEANIGHLREAAVKAEDPAQRQQIDALRDLEEGKLDSARAAKAEEARREQQRREIQGLEDQARNQAAAQAAAKARESDAKRRRDEDSKVKREQAAPGQEGDVETESVIADANAAIARASKRTAFAGHDPLIQALQRATDAIKDGADDKELSALSSAVARLADSLGGKRDKGGLSALIRRIDALEKEVRGARN